MKIKTKKRKNAKSSLLTALLPLLRPSPPPQILSPFIDYTVRCRSMFDIKELHLGHLAKSFALRDRPGKINVPGLRQGKEDTKKDFKAARNGAAGRKRKADDMPSTNTDEAARKMRAKMREQHAGASEFNLA